uniref:Protein kinase-like domain, concanavalin A-like lectin/glucanase domain protein n=1 Tax=Tanacetum cinerariifolium TaxID=118510 RepID=A0A699HNQ2_TANCI|nr:protein kinase-like domain, concanavalin A-like lectin/glucanase domain protein [Tanacetum cinerariifolium]
MTNKIDIVLKAITDQIAGTLPSDMIRNPKLSTCLVLSACSYPTKDLTDENKEEETDNPENIHANPLTPPDLSVSFIIEKVFKLNSFFELLRLVPQSSDTEVVYIKGDEEEVMFIEIIRKNDDSHEQEPEEEGRKVRIEELTFSQKGLKGCMLGRPFVEISNMTHDPPEGVVRFTNENDEVAYKMPHKIEQYNSLSNLEKEHTKSVYLRSEEGKKKGVEYVMSKILGFYKQCLELGPEYATGMDDEGEVT